MPTPSEQKGLAFIAIVILLGGAVRVVRAGDTPVATTAETEALAVQVSAASAAATSENNRRGKTRGRATVARLRRDTVPKTVAGVASVPPFFARPNDPFSHTPYGTQSLDRRGFPPPGPRIDIDMRAGYGAATSIREPHRARSPSTRSLGALDLDRATAHEIESLPRLGPALARRIVFNRDTFGPFGSMEGLQRVKGMGRVTLQRLAPLVTFSGEARHTNRPGPSPPE